MSFSKETLGFLAENQMRDSKLWYNEHKPDYKRFVTEPFAQMIDELRPTFEAIDPRIICDPRRISRLYRDARYSRGMSTFRDNLWTMFAPCPTNDAVAPGYYFDFSPRGFSFGCGYYVMPAKVREAFCELILTGDPAFVEAFAAINGQNVFEVCGELYKRNRYPEADEHLLGWLNRKCVYVSHSSDDFELFYSDRLTPFVADAFLSIAPFWRLLVNAEELSRRQ